MKKGEKYKCIESVVMEHENEFAYIEGKTYPCEQDGCITDEQGDKEHIWDLSNRDPDIWDVNLWKRYFILE